MHWSSKVRECQGNLGILKKSHRNLCWWLITKNLLPYLLPRSKSHLKCIRISTYNHIAGEKKDSKKIFRIRSPILAGSFSCTI